MNPFLAILAGVQALLANTGLTTVGTQQLVGLLQYAASLFREGVGALGDLKLVDEQIQVLVAEGRAPTDQEWEVWDARLRAVDERFARIKETL